MSTAAPALRDAPDRARLLSAGTARAPRRWPNGTVVIFALVFAAQLAFGAWMGAHGFRWGDAFYRSYSALTVLFSTDPKLANIGFVWMPLPALLNLPWVALYPIWPSVVVSGFAAAATSAVAGGATAAVLLVTASRLGLPRGLGWAFAILVSANPMVFLYSSSGMAEGVAAPFLIGAVCFVTLFWHSGQRAWIAAAGIALALGVASVHQAVPYGAALFAAMVGGLCWSKEARRSVPNGRARAVEGLGLLLLVPPAFVGVLWIAFNAIIMGSPLYFVDGAYGYSSYQATNHVVDLGFPMVTGDFAGALAMIGARMWPFTIPLVAVLAVRLADRRLWRVNTLSLILLTLSVPVGLIAPMAYSGSAMGFLRYLMYPLFVAAGWGLYEITMSHRRRRAAGLILAGWIIAVPACWWIMYNPHLGLQENSPLRGFVKQANAQELGVGDAVDARARVARYVDTRVLPSGGQLLLDSFQGEAIAAQVRAEYSKQLVMTFDRRFRGAVADPARFGISYVLVPDPRRWDQDAILRARPRLWAGHEPGFRLVKTIPTTMIRPENWRLFAVEPGARRLPINWEQRR